MSTVRLHQTDRLVYAERKLLLVPGRAKRWALVVSLMNHWDYLHKTCKYLPFEAQHSPNCEVPDNRCQFVQTEGNPQWFIGGRYWKHCHTIPERGDTKAPTRKYAYPTSYNLPTHYPINGFCYRLWYVRNFSNLSEGVWWYTQVSLQYFTTATLEVLHVSARLPATGNQFYDFPHYPYANLWTVISGRTSFNFFVVYPPHPTYRWQHRR